LGGSWCEIFCGEAGIGRKKEKRATKKARKGLWKLAPLLAIRLHRGFPQRLGKHKPLSTVPTRPTTEAHDLFERQRSTLSRRDFGPKDGEHFSNPGQRGRLRKGQNLGISKLQALWIEL